MKFLAMLACLASATSALAQERAFRLAPAHPPTHPVSAALYEPFKAYLAEESGGRFGGQVFGMEVVGLKEVPSALQSGLVEVGLVLYPYFPADFPEQSLTAELALQATDPYVAAAAMTEYVVTCGLCQEEMSRFGAVFLGAGASDVYVLMTTRQVKSVADVRGLRLRANAGPWQRLTTALGGVPVEIASTDSFEALSQGTLDGAMSSVGDLLSQRLMDVITHVTELRLGAYFADSTFTMNKAAWVALPVEDRAVLVRAANRANADFTTAWGFKSAARARAAAAEGGVAFVDPAPELVAYVEKFAASDLKSAAGIAERNLGVVDADVKLARFSALLDRWDRLLADTDRSPEVVSALMQAEIWDKVDLAGYGK
jgi:TRAP-type C4-dicarboxylate transport system substrate-binding protein